MRVRVQNGDYPEIYEVTRVLAKLDDEAETPDGDDCLFKICMESSEYVITLTSSFNEYKECIGTDDDGMEDDSGIYNDWREESEGVYRQIDSALMKNGAVNLVEGNEDCPLPKLIRSDDGCMTFWGISVDVR